jgi:cobalamin biosynthesis protein CobD/CbiB
LAKVEAVRQHVAPEAAELIAHYPAITACRLAIENMPSGEAEAHIEVLLPQHQIVLNTVAPDAEAARRKALEAARAHLAELARRDPRILAHG